MLDHRFLGDRKASGDRSIAAAFGHQREHLTLPGRQAFERVIVKPRSRDHEGDDLGVEDGTSQNVAMSAIRCLSRYPTPAGRSVNSSRVAPLNML